MKNTKLLIFILCFLIVDAKAVSVQNFCFDKNIFYNIRNGVDGATVFDWTIDYNLVGAISVIYETTPAYDLDSIIIYLKPYMVCRQLDYSHYGEEYGDLGTDWIGGWGRQVTMTGNFNLYGPSGWFWDLPPLDFGNRSACIIVILASHMPCGLYRLSGTLTWHNGDDEGTSPFNFDFTVLDPFDDACLPGYFLTSLLIWGKTAQMTTHDDGRGIIVHPLGVIRFYTEKLPPLCSDENIHITAEWNRADIDELYDNNTYEYTPNFLCYFHISAPPWYSEDAYGSEGGLATVAESRVHLNVCGPASELECLPLEVYYRLAARTIVSGGYFEVGTSVYGGFSYFLEFGTEVGLFEGINYQYMQTPDEFTLTVSVPDPSLISPCYCGDEYECDNDYAMATVLDDISEVEHAQNHTIAPMGDGDWFQFYAIEGDRFTFYTTGSTDTYGEIFDDPLGLILVDDDDSGESLNFAISDWFAPHSGWFYLRVRGYDEWTWGCYTLRYSKHSSKIETANLKPCELSMMLSPNPFNSLLKISYTVPIQAQVILEVYDTEGRFGTRLLNTRQDPGTYTVFWTPSNDVPSSLYLVRLKVANRTVTKRAILIR